MSRTRSLWVAGLVGVVVVGGYSSMINAVAGNDTEPAAQSSTVMPDLTGQSLAQIEWLKDAGVELTAYGIDGSSYCGTRSQCVVRKASPKPGTVLQPGDKVTVRFMTSGELAFYTEHKTMPKMVGLSEEKAEAKLDRVRFLVDTRLKETMQVPVGKSRVIAQSPKAGKPLKVGQRIKLTIGFNSGSTSTGDAGVPDVNVNVDHDRGESRFCRGRWWC